MTTRKSLRVGAVATATFVALLGSAIAADAKIVERGQDTSTESFTEEVCGDSSVGPITVNVTGEYHFDWKVRGDIPGSTAYLTTNRFEFREVITNPANGKWLVIRGSGRAGDIKATHVEGNIYSYRGHSAGQLFVMESSDGRTVLRESGRNVFDLVWETLSVDPYRGQFIDFNFVSEHGLRISEEQFCQAAVELIG